MGKRSDWYVSDPLVSKTIGETVIVLAMPAVADDNSVAAVVGIQLRLEDLARLREAAFEVKERVDAMAASAGAIGTNVAAVAAGARETIGRMESAIGRFKV